MLSWKTASPEIAFPTTGLEVLSGDTLRWFWRIPDLAAEDATKTCDLEATDLYDPAMQVTFRATEQVVMIPNFIRIMVTMNEPDVCQPENGGKGLFKCLMQTQVSKYDHRHRSILLNTQDDVVKFPVRVTAKQDH